MRLRSFLKDEQASTAAEFGLLSVVFIGMMLGIVDMARLAFEVNSAKAAARHAARIAVVSLPAVKELIDYDAVACGIPGGQPIPVGGACAPPDYVCQSIGCGSGTLVKPNFDRIVTAVRSYYGTAKAANVVIEYRHRGLGTSGFIGSDIEPLITVRLVGLTFQPISLQMFGVAPFPIPSVATTLTAESLGATSATI